MPDASGVYEELSRTECLELLASQQLGRIAVVIDGRPIVFPINFALDGEAVVFRTAEGTKLTGAAMGWVSFEVDGTDPVTRTGWSVIVQGVGSEITDTLDRRSEQLRQLAVDPWVPDERSRWVEILPQAITGRRLRRPPPA